MYMAREEVTVCSRSYSKLLDTALKSHEDTAAARLRDYVVRGLPQ